MSHWWCCCRPLVLVPCEVPLWETDTNCGDPEPTEAMPWVVEGIGGDCDDCANKLNISLNMPRNPYWPNWHYNPTYDPIRRLECPGRPTILWWVALARCINPTIYFWYCHLYLNGGASAHNDVYWISEIFTEKPDCYDTVYNLELYEIKSDFPDGRLYCDYENSSVTIGPMTAL
jgi:hypothetical protein